MIELDGVEIELELILGRVKIPLSELLEIDKDTLLKTDSEANHIGFLLANSQPFAKVEILVEDNSFSARILKVFDADDVIRFPKEYFEGF